MRYKAINGVSSGASITGDIVDLQFTFTISGLFVWTGTTAGTVHLEASNDLITWTTLPDSIGTASGSAGSYFYDPGDLSGFLWVRPVFTRTSGTGTMSCWIGGKEEIGGDDLSTSLSVMNLEGKYVRTARFVIVNSPTTSGQVTLPEYSTVVLNDFGGTVDAVVSDVSGGRPTATHVLNGLGDPVATTFDSDGNYTFDSTPVSYPVAVIYRVQQKLKNFDSDSLDIIGGVEITDISFSSESFGIVNVPTGTDPSATIATDTLNITTTEATITVSGTGSNTINFHVPGALVHPTVGSTYEYAGKPPSISGTGNTFIGFGAGDSVTSGAGNTGFGNSALTALTTGTNNTAVGVNLGGLTTGSTNTAVGTSVLNAITTSSGLCGIGNSVFNGTTSGSGAIGVGESIGSASWIPGNFVTVGTSICNQPLGVPSNISDTVAIGSGIFSCDGSPAISGAFAIGQNIFGGTSHSITNVVAIGTQIGNGLLTTAQSLLFGFNIAFTGSAGEITNSIVMGRNIFENQSDPELDGCVFIGNGIAQGGTSTVTANSVVIGPSAGGQLTTAIDVTLIGSGAGPGITEGSRNICIGASSGGGLIDATDTVCIGSSTMGNGNISNSVALGTNALAAINTGARTMAIGPGAMQTASGATDSVAIGYQAMTNVSSENSVYDRVVGIGASCGQTSDTNTDIVLIGYKCEPSGIASTREFCVGGNDQAITRYWFGNGGLAMAGTSDITFSPTSSSGTDQAGADFIYQSGNGTGTGGSGEHQWFTAPGAASSSTVNTMTKTLSLDKNGNLRMFTSHNNATAQGSATEQDIRSGTYTPTLTNVTNVAVSTAYSCQWMRVGNTVTVSGKVDIDPTAAAATELGLSLPVASNLGAEEDLAGCASGVTAGDDPIAVRADAANNRAAFIFTAVSVANQSRFFTFTYEVI